MTATPASPGDGWYRVSTFLHEVIHGLGMDHPFDMAAGSTQVPNATAFNNEFYTVMSYSPSTGVGGGPAGHLQPPQSTFGHAVTPMAIDIKALQAMYGANMSTHTGDTVYTLSDPGTAALDVDGSDGTVSIGRAYYSVWDADGDRDRVEYRNNSAVLINLNDAELVTVFGGDRLEIVSDIIESKAVDHLSPQIRLEIFDPVAAGGGQFSSVLNGNNRIDGGYTIANDVKIEDAQSGEGDDTLIGSKEENRLSSWGGDDYLIGGQGNDYLGGWDGDDTYHGGDGYDTVLIDKFDLDDPDNFSQDPVLIWNFAASTTLPGYTDYQHESAGSASNNGNDTIKEIERMVLTYQGDVVEVNDYALQLPERLLIDMNRFKPGPVFKSDWDTLDFSSVSSGITYVDGAISAKGAASNGPLELSRAGKEKEAALFVDTLLALTPEMVATANGGPTQPLTVLGAQQIIGTQNDDTIYVDASQDDWNQTETESNGSPAFGEISGGAGDDYLIHLNGVGFPPGTEIDRSYGGSILQTPPWFFGLLGGDPRPSVTGEEMRMTLKGGEGSDRVYAYGGAFTEVSGGKGSDLLFNSSFGGTLYGGGVDARGDGETDIFWFWPGTFIKDAEKNDLLELFGIPLGGGTNLPFAGGADAASMMIFLKSIAQNSIAMDWSLPFIFYGVSKSGQLLVYNQVYDKVGIGDASQYPGLIPGVVIVEDYDFGAYTDSEFAVPDRGDLNMTFRTFGPNGPALEISPHTLAWGYVITLLKALNFVAKGLNWQPTDDPLVLDLDGDGIETVDRFQSGAYFDVDGDYFRERTGWLKSDDGFLVADWNGNGVIDDIAEMFGGPDSSGYAELAAFDDNADGIIDASDAVFDILRIWTDFDQDGASSDIELKTLAEHDIVSIGAGAEQQLEEEVFGNLIRAQGTFTRTDGSTGDSFEIIFDHNNADTIYRGDRGLSVWLDEETTPDGKGIGSIANLAVDIANDFVLAETVFDVTAQMTVPDLADLRDKATPIFGQWSQSLELTRELTPVLLHDGPDGITLVDHAIYVEDELGGYFELSSGNPVLDGDGLVIDRPDMQNVLNQAVAAGQIWQVEQVYSPQTRADEVQFRDAAPYLVEIVDDRAVVVDYGIQNQDGSWSLASGDPVTDADGVVIASPTVDDILAMAPPQGRLWRFEQLGFNPYANPAVDRIGINIIDGQVVDYSVEITDVDGKFHVWSRNLDRALELQDKLGRSGEYNLRNYEIDFDTLDEVGSTDDSAYRVELLTAGQLHFATSLYGVDFQPQIMSAQTDIDTGMLSYSVGSFRADDGVDIGETGNYDPTLIDTAIEMMGLVMDSYITISRAFAVRLALQTGLAPFASGLNYLVNADKFEGATDYELTPVFDAILAAAPAGEVEATEYLQAWHEILEVIYPDFAPNQAANFFAATLRKDQVFVAQHLIPAFENNPIDLDLAGIMNALGLEQDRLVDHAPDAVTVDGTSGDDWIYLSAGDQTYRGGHGKDVYLVGQNFGHDVIYDLEEVLVAAPQGDELRFTALTSDDVHVTVDGLDLVFEVTATGDTLRIRDHFLGDLIDPLFGNNFADDTGVGAIIFADGELWNWYDTAFAASHPMDTDDVVVGTESRDVLQGGKGNDVLRGGRDGDVYIFHEGDGHDRIIDQNDRPTDDPLSKMDFVQIVGDITAERLRFERDGESNDMRMVVLDEFGAETGDSLSIEGQFKWINIPLIGLLFGDAIERVAFEDGSFLTDSEIMVQILEDAKTSGEDVIYGFHNADILDGGAGDDLLIGRAQNDTYIYGRDYGSDVVRDGHNDLFASNYDVVEFIDDLRWSDFVFERDADSPTVSLRVKGTTDSLILQNQYRSQLILGFTDMIERLDFADGTSWDFAKLAQHYVDLAATDGDDTIYGFDISDRLDGGLGNDRLEGGRAADTYIFARGYGNDTVYDTGSSGQGDSLEMQDIAFGDVTIDRDGDDLIFTVIDTGERLILEDQYNRQGAQKNAIETFKFSDITVDFRSLNPDQVDVVGTANNETLIGSDFAETLDGRAGDDELIGGSDGDTYLFDVGYGTDVIVDTQKRVVWQDRGSRNKETDDRVLFGSDINVANAVYTKDGDDLVISIVDRTDTLRIRNQFASISEGVEWFEYQDGTRFHISDVEELLAITGGSRGDDYIEGSLDNPNVLDGRQGDDILVGGRAGDTYAFGAAYDLDEIRERSDPAAGAIDRVVFGTLVDPDSVRLLRDLDDLIIDLGNGEDRLTITNGLSTQQVELFVFADGTEWNLEDIRNGLTTGTEADDIIRGFDDRDDLLDGLEGSDALEGGLGNDTYAFGLGSGADSVFDNGGVDQIVFGTGISAPMITFSDENGSLLVRVAGSDDTLIIIDHVSGQPENRIENFVFEDGTTITSDDVTKLLVRDQSTSGDDVINARVGIPLDIEMGAGDDLVIAGRDASFIFRVGDGSDIIDTRGQGGSSTLKFVDQSSDNAMVRKIDLDGDDVVIAFPDTGEQVTIRGALTNSNLQRIQFANETEWSRDDLVAAAIEAQQSDLDNAITGSNLADLIEGGLGDDDSQGGAGDDIYLFNRGDGRDVIADTSGTDRLEIRGYRPEDVKLTKPVEDRDEIVLSFEGSEDEILLRFVTGGIEFVGFGDGTEWTREDLFAAVVGQGTPYDDVLLGSTADETFEGLTGADFIDGKRGNDTYIYSQGDGRDVIDDTGLSSETNTLVINGYGPSELTIVRHDDRSDDLILRFPAGDEITIIDGFDLSSSRITVFRFEDGTEWNLDDVLLALESQRQADRDEILTGTDADDTLVGEGGDDLLTGERGNDTYVFNRGDGRDVISDEGYFASSADRIDLRGYLPADLIVSQSPRDPDDLLIEFFGSNDSITIRGGLSSSTGGWIEEIVFTDGSVVTRAEMLADLFAGTGGDDDTSGSPGPDLLPGSPGNDRTAGLNGNDTYTFTRSDGQDILVESNSGSNVLQIFGYFPEDVTVTQHPARKGSVVLTFDGTDDRVTLDQGGSDEHEFSRIEFIDGTVWNRAAIDGFASSSIPVSAGNDDVVGFDSAADIIQAGPGQDAIDTLNGSDVLVFALGDGRDTVLGSRADTLRLTDLNPSDIRLLGDIFDDGSITMVVIGARDSIRFEDGANVLNRIEFADGTIWNSSDIAGETEARPAPVTDGPVTISGSTAAETFESTAADEFYLGGRGSDTYRYEIGDGHDRIQDYSSFETGTTDTIEFIGIASTDFVAAEDRQNSNHLLITFPGQDGSVLVQNFYSSSTRYRIEAFTFSDGVTLTHEQMVAIARPLPTPDNDRLVGTDNPDVIDALGGNDTIDALDGDDTLTGGPGDDTVIGGSGADIYEFNPGDGHDLIVDTAGSAPNILNLHGVLAADISVTWDQLTGHAVMSFSGSSDRISFASSQFASIDYDPASANISFGKVVLDDGTELDDTALNALMTVPPLNIWTGTPGDDAPANSSDWTQFDGQDGNDTFTYSRGDGVDHFLDWGYDDDALEIDALVLTNIGVADITGISRLRDLTYRIEYGESAAGAADGGSFIVRMRDPEDTGEGFIDPSGIEEIRLADGAVWELADVASRVSVPAFVPTDGSDRFFGSEAAEIIELGRGDDDASGNGGNDTYIYNRGDGDDIYDDSSSTGIPAGTLQLVAITPAEVSTDRRYDDLLISIAPRAGDGSDAGSILLERYFSSSSAWTGITLGFDDGTIWAEADLYDPISSQQTAGDDVIAGTDRNDTLEPGAGNDVISAGEGQNTLVYARGDGDDVVKLETYNSTLLLDFTDLLATNVTVLRHGNDLLLDIAESAPGAGDGGSVRVLDGFSATGSDEISLQQVTFGDGTVWDRNAIAAAWIAGRTSTGDDLIENAGPASTYEAGPGNDRIETGQVGDTYIYRNGDGHDTIIENGNYIYADYSAPEPYASDLVHFADLQQSDMVFSRLGDDLVISIGEDAVRGIVTGSVTLVNQFATYPGGVSVLELLRFSDGTEVTVASVIAAIVAAAATDGDDYIRGSDLDDVFEAGLGDDVTTGRNGSDTYIYNRGDGADIIIDIPGSSFSNETDTLRLVGIDPASVSFGKIIEGIELIIAESAPGAADAGSIIIHGQLDGSSIEDTGIERIEFDDGTVYETADITEKVLLSQSTEFDDVLLGGDSDDLLIGGRGNDTMRGGEGSDTYVYTRGDGFDLIEDNQFDSRATNRLELHGITPDQVVVRLFGANDLLLEIVESAPDAGDNGQIIVRNSYITSSFRGLDEATFDDGTVWTSDQFEALASRNLATPGDDRLEGTSDAEVLEGLQGDDLLIGSLGDDTYLYTRGDGADVIRESGSDTDRIEIAGYSAEEVSFERQGRDGVDLIIRLADEGDSITVVNGLASFASSKVEQIVLVDGGEAFQLADIEAVLVLGEETAGDDQIIGSVAADLLQGGKGIDLLVGNEGDDTYTYRAGDGDDRITDSGTSTGDRLILPDINPDDLVWARRSPANGDDLVLRFTGLTDRLHLTDTLDPAGKGIDIIEFADGTEWGIDEMRSAVLQSWNTDGDERIRGFESADILQGGRGKDWMIGDGGSDIYRFASGDGQDTIDDISASAGDRLEIADLSSLEVSAHRLFKGSDAIVLRFAGSDDTITIRNALSETGEGIEEIVFSDGIVWTRQNILDALDNAAPVAVEDGVFSARLEEPLILSAQQLIRNDFDPDGEPLAIIAVDGGDNGTAQIDGDGNIVFTSATGFLGATQFSYTVSDGRNGLATATVNIRVVPPASAKDDTGFEVEEDGFLNIDVLRLLSNDADGDQMVVSQVFDATNGSASLSSDGQISFTPAADYTGLASFKYVANTPDGGRSEATVYINVLAVNDNPVAADDAGFETVENVTLAINPFDLLANDSDVDGDRLSIVSVVGSAELQAVLTAYGDILVTPTPYYFGTASFDYVISDGAGGTDTATRDCDRYLDQQ